MSYIEIVAEIGSNWDSLQSLEESIQALKGIATAFKVQVFQAHTLYSPVRAPKLYRSTKRFELPLDWIPKLSSMCKDSGLRFWASVFDKDLIEHIAHYVDTLKVASGDITNARLLKKVGESAERMHCRVAFSDGAATEAEIYQAIDTFGQYKIDNLTLLHCVSAYPARPEDYQLAWLQGGIREDISTIGLSDHTRGNLTAIMGVALGCTVFEKHVKPVSLSRVTPDSGEHSATLDEFKRYVEDIYTAVTSLGVPGAPKHVAPSESPERLWARRGADGLRPVDSVHEEGGKYNG